ncbi:MAG: SH3 domain-containing protein [Pelagimonas sp.]|uniref:SH3 domain-containing protein n=1 Tax=Pelagimonas sp. TaxID=2073170 RepID=UPI003D6B141B
MLRFIAICLCLAGPAVAADFPALYNVIDVASDDTLNIRSKPSSKGEVIGVLEHNDAYVQIEAFDASGRWAQVSAGEAGMGWVFARYLQAVPGATFPDWPYLQCSGSEAAWSLRYADGDGVMYRAGYEGPGRHLASGPIVTASENTKAKAIMASDGSLHVSALIENAQCWSTMIDAFSGLEATVFVTGEQQQMMHGCCSLMAP